LETRVIKRMVKIARSDRRIKEDELSMIAAIADKFDGQKECSKHFLKEFGYDPFA